MSSVAVPKKMVPVPNVYGVESFKEIKPEIVALHPVQHKNTIFSTAAQNRISFRIPAYANALMDNSRSFIHMRLASNVIGSNGAYLANGLPIFDRIVVKTSAGLTLEDVSDLDVLRVMLDSIRPADTVSQSSLGNQTVGVGDYLTPASHIAGKIPGYLTADLFTGPITYKEVLFKFDFGIFSKKLTKFLPLFMADGGAGYAFDVDLYLSDKGVDRGNLLIHSPVWYMHLMRMDEGLARRFNQMAVHGEEIRIPFTTWHTHRTALTSNNIIAYIHENATNFKKILTCLHATNDRLVSQSSPSSDAIVGSGMMGGINKISGQDAVSTVNSPNTVSSYNYRVGVQHVYNEPVQETSSNTRTLQFVKSAFGYSDDTVLQTELHDNLPGRTPANTKSRMFEAERWCSVASFDYSPGEEGVIQGISTSNPVELSLKVDNFDSALATIVLNYCELAYDLVFKGGSIHYEEQKPGSQSVY